MGKYFGTDGFRGEANVHLTVEHAYKVGRFLGWYYGQEHRAKIVIGKDTRRSSYMFESSLVAGLTASGADVFLLHVTTTPSVSYVVRTEGFDCGIMIYHHFPICCQPHIKFSTCNTVFFAFLSRCQSIKTIFLVRARPSASMRKNSRNFS